MALVVSSQRGGSGKSLLPGASSDAQAMARTLHSLGGVSSSDLILLEDPDSSRLIQEFERLAERVAVDRSHQVPSEVFFYHAGHAGLDGLELGDTLLPWAKVRDLIRSTQATARVAILDACASGAALRARGGRFVIPAPESVRGEAWLVSSRAEEISLETDADGGGIFTRVLLAGLRGAADRDEDGVVTLDEAFRHVSGGVRARARELGSAPQTPQWSSSLAGDQSLALTRPSRGASLLEVPASTTGTLLTDSVGNGEAWIAPDSVVTRIYLDPGLHSAWRIAPDGRSVVRFVLREGTERSLEPAEFVDLPAPSAPHGSLDTALRSVPVNFGLLSPLTMNGQRPELARNAFSLDLILGDAGRITGFQMAGVLNRVRRDVVGFQFSDVANIVEGDVRGAQLSLVNLLGGGVRGAQVAGYLNLDEGVSRGAQIAGLMNVNRDSMTGAQLSIGSSYAGTLRGAQISLVNVAGSMSGSQIGLVNIARSSTGLQAGLLNISGQARGVAAGLVNILPRSRALAVGAINVGSDLEVHPEVAFDPTHPHRWHDVQITYATDWIRSLLVLGFPRPTDWNSGTAEFWGLGGGAQWTGPVTLSLDLLVLSESPVFRDPVAAFQVGARRAVIARFSPLVKVRWQADRLDDPSLFLGIAF